MNQTIIFRHGLNFAAIGAIAAILGSLAGCGGDAADSERENVETPQTQNGGGSEASASIAGADLDLDTERDPEDVVVSVDGYEIRQADINREVDNMLSRFGGSMPPDQLAQMRTQIASRALDQLIIGHLLETACDDAGIEISEEDVEMARAEITQDLPEDRSLQEMLAMNGISLEKFEEELKKSLRIQKLFEEETASPASPTDEDIAGFYEQNKEQMETPEQVSARHILLNASEEAGEDERAAQKEKADEIRQQLSEGADFAEMVKEHSDDPGSIDKGGEYTFSRGQMVPEFEKAAFEQEIGEIGPVIETQFGYHIVEVLERSPAQTQSLEEATEGIRAHLENESKGQAVQEYIEKLREQADIKYM